MWVAAAAGGHKGGERLAPRWRPSIFVVWHSFAANSQQKCSQRFNEPESSLKMRCKEIRVANKAKLSVKCREMGVPNTSMVGIRRPSPSSLRYERQAKNCCLLKHPLPA